MEPAAQPFDTLSGTGEPSCESGRETEFFGTALELLETLRAEEQILKRFSGPELLALLPQKEYLANELEWKLRSAKESASDSFEVSDSFRALLDEIKRQNASNGVFIQRSLSYWQDLEAILLPPGYGRTGRKGPGSMRPPRGVTFRQEV